MPFKDTPKVEIEELAEETVLEPFTKSVSLMLNVLEAEVMNVPDRTKLSNTETVFADEVVEVPDTET